MVRTQIITLLDLVVIQRTTRVSIDVLDDFSPNIPTKPAPAKTDATKAAKAAPPPPAASTRSPDVQDMKFVEELAREMESMLLGLGSDKAPSGSADGASTSDAKAGEEAAREKQFLSAWEEFVAKSTDGVPPDDGEVNAGEDFKDAFRKSRDEAAERLRKSDTELQVAGPPTEDDLAALLDLEDESSLQNLLEGMMGQLMSKEVLYEPLKELNDKFPSYLASNKDKLSASDLERYEAQHACASKIIAVFEDAGYKDDDPGMTAEIVALMSKMQEHGAPPAEIMGELPPGLDLGPDGAPKLPDECVIG
ncbi:Pex19 protein family-domain-containing protein [Russula compacta]|nr:Pex19 protein family-domain-containing protein [Russula compacta]